MPTPTAWTAEARRILSRKGNPAMPAKMPATAADPDERHQPTTAELVHAAWQEGYDFARSGAEPAKPSGLRAALDVLKRQKWYEDAYWDSKDVLAALAAEPASEPHTGTEPSADCPGCRDVWHALTDAHASPPVAGPDAGEEE